MRYSRMLLPTLKESPADAEVISQKLMIRAGMIRKVAAGIYNLLPLGHRVVRKVEAIVREEMNRAGAQEVLMPMVVPAELWQESGRWDAYGKELLRLKDRHEREFCLGPTHEEVITDMVRREVRSYRELPLNLYQIQTKFRDEIRPRFGLMRGREFIMKDAYSFHATPESLDREYENMHRAYTRIFERCALQFRAVEAETGAIGGRFSHEFMVLADSGEDSIASCTRCGYAANIERAEVREPHPERPLGELPVERVSTPGMRTIEEVSAFLKAAPSAMIKTLIYETDRGIVAALVRGDHQLNEFKFRNALNAAWVRLADEAAVERATGAPAGFAGPVRLKVPVYADHAVRRIFDGVTGANEKDAHLVHVSAARDFPGASYADIRNALAGDMCPRCEGAFEIRRGIEVGHIFKLGTKYSEAMGATFLDEEGRERPAIMGCYGIGVGRTAAAAIEQNHDEAGIIWPGPLAPFDCEVLPVNVNDEGTKKTAEALYERLSSELEVLLDDRDERAGVKFKDADLIGIPVRVVVGERNLKQGKVELKVRKTGETKLVGIEEVSAEVGRVLGK
ncbi:MAG: proline--tRNA ligase [Deltaproteobacteria bacterium]|nr:proline--tRNA ligase [Deltaproteobacteria bacterium]MCL4872850.1 proline--tRNA ligase [bacterium]